MSCSNTHGPATYRQFISDTTGETISQDEWHEIREMAGASGGDMGKGYASTDDALKALDALAASITGNSYYHEKKTKEQEPDWGTANERKIRAAFEAGFKQGVYGDDSKLKQAYAQAETANIYDFSQPATEWRLREEERARQLAAEQQARAKARSTAAPQQPDPAANIQSYDKAKAAIIAGKVTKGTVAVIRFIAIVGIKPLLEYLRKKRAEEKRIKKQEKEIRRAIVRARRGW
jgi:hypothetical protein